MKTLFVGQNLIHLDCIDSTNSYAIDLLNKQNLIEGTIIQTFNQTKGRGQRGNNWDSKPNENVALSLIMKPSFLNVREQFLLSKITALALTDLMSELLTPVNKADNIAIKWPNDIYMNDKKIAGILIENSLSGNAIKHSIIGIGININQHSFSQEYNATSLKLNTGQNYNLNSIVIQLASHLEARYLQLKNNKLATINEAYLNLLYKKDTWANFKLANSLRIRGKIKGVSDIGKLLLEDLKGNLHSFNFQEIKLLVE